MFTFVFFLESLLSLTVLCAAKCWERERRNVNTTVIFIIALLLVTGANISMCFWGLCYKWAIIKEFCSFLCESSEFYKNKHANSSMTNVAMDGNEWNLKNSFAYGKSPFCSLNFCALFSIHVFSADSFHCLKVQRKRRILLKKACCFLYLKI